MIFLFFFHWISILLFPLLCVCTYVLFHVHSLFSAGMKDKNIHSVVHGSLSLFLQGPPII